MPIQLNAEDLLNGLEYMSKSSSSSDNIHTYMKSTVHVLMYNEMSKYSKEELESVKSKWRNENLYTRVMGSKCSLFLCALLEKGAYTHILCDHAKWMLGNIEASPQLYQSIYDVQASQFHKEDKFRKFSFALIQTVKDLPENKKLETANKLFHDYHEKFTPELLEMVVNNLVSHEVFCSQILKNFNNSNIDINKTLLLDNYLKEIWEKKEYSNLFIPSDSLPKIHKLLKKGFKFTEDNYNRFGFNLMTTVLKSERVDIVATILPYLTMSNPIGITLDEQTKLLDLYKNSKAYNEIKTTYYAKLYDFLLEDKNEMKSPKVKI